MRPAKKIKLFASLPHGHSTAIKIKTTIVRNGTEVDEVIRVDNFNMNHQVDIELILYDHSVAPEGGQKGQVLSDLKDLISIANFMKLLLSEWNNFRISY